MQHQNLIITQQPLANLQPDPNNARHHTKRQIKQIARSIASFGFNVPVIIDDTGKIIAGHGRVMAAREMGWQAVPVIQLAHLSPAQARAFAIADNRLTENSSWDENLLGESLRELASLDLDFSLEATGFTMAEIDLKIEGVGAPTEKEDSADAVVGSTGPAVTAVGDLWQLGQHRILCSDALQAESYKQLLEGRLAEMVFTDPPYNLKVDGHCTGLGSVRHREFPMASGEMSVTEFTDFLGTACHLLAQHSADGSLHYICMDWRHASELLAAGSQAYHELKNICVWVKDNGGMGSLYRSQHELVFIYKHGKAPHRNNIELGKYGRYRTNVWRYPGANSLSRESGENNPLAMHPTVKPVVLIADAIMDCSARGDIVLDTFLGSGSTVLAAERVGRACYGMELDPLYVDLAIRRWQRYTGLQAIHIASGQTFDALEAHHGR